MIYVFVSLATYLLMSWHEAKLKRRKDLRTSKKLFDYYNFQLLLVLVFVLVAGLRNVSIGVDTINYQKNFHSVFETKGIKTIHPFELFYQLLNLIVAILVPNKQLGWVCLLIICELIIIINVFYSVKKLSSDKKMSIFLFVTIGFYLMSLNQIRQAISISFLMVATVCLRNKQNLKFLIWVFVAALFHKSSIIYLILLVLTNLKCKYWHYIAFAGVSLSICIAGDPLISALCKLIKFDYFYKYLNAGFVFSLSTKLKAVACVIIWLFIIVYSFKKEKQLNNKLKLFMDIFFIANCLYVIAWFGNAIYTRLTSYFYWIIILLVPEFIKIVQNKRLKNLLTISAYAVGLLYLIICICFLDSMGVVPYLFF